jgi:hypothetical protein
VASRSIRARHASPDAPRSRIGGRSDRRSGGDKSQAVVLSGYLEVDMNAETLEAQLLALIRERKIVGQDAQLELDTDLRDGGHVDSMRFVALMALLEELGAQKVDYALENPDEVRTVRQLVRCCF